MQKVFILLGSNMGDSLQQLQTAINYMPTNNLRVVKYSNVYKTKAWGNTNQNDFLNAVVEVHTNLSPEQTLQTLLTIEEKMGRVRTEEKWQPRIIDLDILYYNQEIIDIPHLKIPHPYIAMRMFTLVPLCDIAPNFMHPVIHQSNLELKQLCKDEVAVDITNFHLSIKVEGQ